MRSACWPHSSPPTRSGGSCCSGLARHLPAVATTPARFGTWSGRWRPIRASQTSVSSSGQALVRVGRYADAIPPLTVARDRRRGLGRTRPGLALADALSQLGRPREARDALDRAVAATSGERACDELGRSGLMAMRLQDPVDGERLFRRAVAATRRLPTRTSNLGLVADSAGQGGEALRCSCARRRDRAVESSIRYNIAVALAQEGRLAEARAQAEMALRLRPDYPQALEMVRRLDGLSQ